MSEACIRYLGLQHRAEHLLSLLLIALRESEIFKSILTTGARDTVEAPLRKTADRTRTRTKRDKEKP